MIATIAPVFTTARYRANRLSPGDAPRLQRFFEANPEYDLMVSGEAPKPGAALEEIESTPPAAYPYKATHVLAFDDARGEMAGMAGVVEDLFAPRVWHIGLFVVATSLQGTGAAREMYDALEAWIRSHNVRWIRLGVVDANERGKRFWRRHGYEQVRTRHAMPYGKLSHDTHVLIKRLDGGTLEDYLALVARDRPESP